MHIVANLCGLGAMISLFLIYQQKNRKNMLICKLSADIFWILHYGCIGAAAGMVPNFVGIFRELVFIMRGKKKWASFPIWAVFFATINFCLGFRAFEHCYDIIPIIASAFVTFSLWINNPRLTKIVSAPVSAAFLVYDVFVGSYMGIVNETLSIVSIIIYFAKRLRKGEEYE